MNKQLDRLIAEGWASAGSWFYREHATKGEVVNARGDRPKRPEMHLYIFRDPGRGWFWSLRWKPHGENAFWGNARSPISAARAAERQAREIAGLYIDIERARAEIGDWIDFPPDRDDISIALVHARDLEQALKKLETCMEESARLQSVEEIVKESRESN